MKKFFSILMAVMLATRGLGADAANDLILSQRKADNSGSIQRNVAPTARGFFTFDGSKVPASTTDLTYTTPTLSAPASFLISGAGDVTINAFGVGGVSDKNVYLNTNPGGFGLVGIGQFATGPSAIPVPGSPGYQSKYLHLAEYGAAGVFIDVVAGSASITARYTGNLPTAPTAVTNGAFIFFLNTLGYDGTAYSTDASGLRFRASENWTSTGHGTGISFTSIPNGSTVAFQSLGIGDRGTFSSTPIQPVSVATATGTSGGAGFSFTGAAGGNTTIATTGTGGIGNSINLTGGAGGTAAAAVTASTGGAGGAVTISSGVGGAAAVSGSGTGTGGNAGAFTMSTGTGGAASTSTGVNLGGTGGSWTFTTGNGGAATNGSSNTGGAAGNITLTTGNGGAGATAAGNSGTLNLVTGTAGSGGTVGNIIFKVGNVQTLAVSGGAAATLTGGAGNMTITAGTGASRTLTLQTTTSGSTATTFLSGDASQNTTISKLITSYNGISTAGNGVVTIVKATRVTAQSAANSSICTYTTPASDGSYEVSANMNVTASTTLSTTLTCTYTDESNTARTLILPVTGLTGSFVALGSISGAGASVWETPVMHIRCKASTAITILTSAGTFSGVTYTAEGIIKQMQ